MLHVLFRVTNYMGLDQQRCLMKTFVTSQWHLLFFFVWIFHSRHANNCIIVQIKELTRAIEIRKPNFWGIIKTKEKDNFVTVHLNNLHLVYTEIWVRKYLAPHVIMKEVFSLKILRITYVSTGIPLYLSQKIRTA